jgi:hypothetical protein
MYQHGDLIFTQIGSDANAISVVTKGYRGARLNHMGVVLHNSYGWFVLEAFPPEVRVTQLEVFLRRSEDPVNGRRRSIVARLLPAFQHLIPAAVTYGLGKRDVPYDQLYLTAPSALYCSELVVDMFRSANGDQDFFPERPMSFRDFNTGEILPAWIEYYEKFGMDVPDGQPGSNPGDISTDARLQITAVVGPPAGYQS